MGESLSGKGFFGWLGRQVGYVKKAVQSDVSAPPPDKVLFRNERVSEATPDASSGVKLRRTVIDEVIADGSGKQGGANEETRGH